MIAEMVLLAIISRCRRTRYRSQMPLYELRGTNMTVNLQGKPMALQTSLGAVCLISTGVPYKTESDFLIEQYHC